MTSRAAALALCLALAAPRAGAQPPVETYSLEDSIRLALRNNAELQSSEQGITIARQQVREAALQFYPEVGLQALATRFNSRYPFALRPDFRSLLLFPSNDPNLFSGQAYMTMSLYEGRRHINTLRLARTALKQAQSKYDAVKLDIVYSVQETFHNLLLAQESADGLRGLADAAERAPVGDGWDAVEAAALASELRAEQAAAEHRLSLARLEFLKRLNKELDSPIVVSGELETRPSDVDLKKALVWATELRPELQSQTYKSQMDAIAVNLSLSRRNPTVMLGLDYEVTGQRFPLRQNNWDATVGVRIPFAFDYWTQHTQRVAEQRQGEIARAELRDRVHLEVRKAYDDLMHWQAEWPRREKEYERLKAMSDRIASRLGRGARSLSASTGVFKARLRYRQAVLEHILARARLERAIGRTLGS